MIVYFTGGARSGKSRHAENYIKNKNYDTKIYIATGIAFDDEMKDRVIKHQKNRGDSWLTIEKYKNLKDFIPNGSGVILLDCLTNMVSNLMLEQDIDWDNTTMDIINHLESSILKEIKEFLDFIKTTQYDLVVVSNEIGWGIVPSYPLGRHFRDICGRANALVGEYSEEAYLVVSNLQIKLK